MNIVMDGKILNEPEHAFSHSMDAIRYAFDGLINVVELEQEDFSVYETDYG